MDAQVDSMMVSCLMAAHNSARTIVASIASVQAQTWSDWELIIVDDGSTDETAVVAAGIDDARVVVLRQERGGPSAARNRALAVARGEFVAPIDADDVWLPRKLELQVEALRRRPEAAVAYGWTDFVDEELRPLYADLRPRFEGRVLEELLRKNFVACGSNTLMRRTAVLEVGGFDETLQAAEDWELHTRLAARHSFAGVAEVVVFVPAIAAIAEQPVSAGGATFSGSEPESVCRGSGGGAMVGGEDEGGVLSLFAAANVGKPEHAREVAGGAAVCGDCGVERPRRVFARGLAGVCESCRLSYRGRVGEVSSRMMAFIAARRMGLGISAALMLAKRAKASARLPSAR